MAVKIRLSRQGRHESPFYRIVVADSRFTRDGRYIEQIGYYDPAKGIENAHVNEEIAIKWLNCGAQYSDTIKAILKSKGLIVKAKELQKANSPKKEVKAAPAAKKAPAKKAAAPKKTTKKAASKKVEETKGE